jgi:hypothetical protein
VRCGCQRACSSTTGRAESDSPPRAARVKADGKQCIALMGDWGTGRILRYSGARRHWARRAGRPRGALPRAPLRLLGQMGKEGTPTAKREAPRAVVRRCGGWRERLAGRAPGSARTGMRRERAVRWLFVHWSFVWGQRSLPLSQHDWNTGGLRQTGAEARCGHALPVARQFARALTAAAPSAGPDHPTVGAPAIVRGSLAQAPPLPKQQGRTG